MRSLISSATSPGNAEVETIVWLEPRDAVGIVAWSWLEPDVPVFGGRDLRRVGLVAANKSSEQLAGFRRDPHCQKEMPHHRHSVAPQDEPLNIRKIQRGILRS